jgi:hypothetical protein
MSLIDSKEGFHPFSVEVGICVKYCSHMSREVTDGVKILQVGIQNI